MARSCDSCARRNAQWYCAADDAFLCQQCDASVHSANPLVLRHHRLELRTPTKQSDSSGGPTWLSGFTPKARTRRTHNKSTVNSPLVPEIETSEENNDDNVEELFYRVPIFDPVAPFLDYNSNMEVKLPMTITESNDCLVGLLPSDTDMAEFAADMESLLGGGLDNDYSFSMENRSLFDSHLVKEEQLDGEETKAAAVSDHTKCHLSGKKVGLRLDYEAIVAEWSSGVGSSSPWMNGERPQFGPGDCWLDYMEMWGAENQVQGEVGGGHIDPRREARVSRYREKRRTRLFSKKIRYEVRKLNAEKRPRMKGRFVKRASFAATSGIK